MVSAETALAVPALLTVLALCLAGVDLCLSRVRCAAGAAVAVRALVRGDPPDTVRQGVAVVAPGAAVSWTTGGSLVTVRVSSTPRALGLLGLATPVSAEAVGRLESSPP